MKIFYSLILLSPIYAMAATEYDIVPRTINFLIFIAILYYFSANFFKNFYKNRIIKISSKIDEIQKNLLESKAKKIDIMKKIEEAKANSVAAISMAKKEADAHAQKIKEEAQSEIALLEQNFEEQKKYELRKMKKEVVSSVLQEIFEDPNISLKQNEIIDIISKKVS
ncbi:MULTISPECIES: F0F1 ATP synthase subunit B [Campylobacter]|uniref:ATP synthase subunit b n=1 Tax=Campylobacter taeniopygiae TaxID=2510188 RepID=A0ABY2TIV4_9BACT|nr:F0F1 ATP synthase subunit B [Campylobacter taeniopygiae]MBZ7936077.1 F0F1 ATP synthase subunit B [Campylobacter sp. B0100352/1]TKX33776.1 F0F1 ATP synthase subunit B [Campylobacter taeniopygiae]